MSPPGDIYLTAGTGAPRPAFGDRARSGGTGGQPRYEQWPHVQCRRPLGQVGTVSPPATGPLASRSCWL